MLPYFLLSIHCWLGVFFFLEMFPKSKQWNEIIYTVHKPSRRRLSNTNLKCQTNISALKTSKINNKYSTKVI